MTVISGRDMVPGGQAFGGQCAFRCRGSREHPRFSRVTDRDCDLRAGGMDKDNRDDFTFAKLSDLKVPVTLRMSAIFVKFIPQNCA